jgi:hypothetical protein
MNTSCEELPLSNLNAPKVESHRKRTGKTEESIKQDQEDAIKVMSLVALDGEVCLDDRIEPEEKYLIDTMPDKAKTDSSRKAGVGKSPGGSRRPHYTSLFALDNRMVFQAACCLPLTVIAASLDREAVIGKVLYNSHSENEGGKLVYEFQGKGSELIIDVKRGKSTRAQRLIFKK